MDRPFIRFHAKWFWDFWDALYLLVLMNVLATFSIITVIGVPLSLAGIFEVAALVSQGKPAGWSDFWRGVKTHSLGVMAVMAINLVMAASIVAGFIFYPAMLGTPGYLLAGLVFWLGVATMLSTLYIPVFQARLDLSFMPAWRLSIFLLLAHPLYTVYTAVWLVLFCAACMPMFFLLPFILFSGYVVGLTAAWTVISRHYLTLEGFIPTVPDRKKAAAGDDLEDAPTKAKTWGEIKKKEKVAHQERQVLALENDELLRSWREILRPWDYDQ